MRLQSKVCVLIVAGLLVTTGSLYANKRQEFINIVGVANGPGTITVRIRERSTNRLVDSITFAAVINTTQEQIRDGLQADIVANPVVGYRGKRFKNKPNVTPTTSVWRVSACRDSVDFYLTCVETIPGITCDPKDTAGEGNVELSLNTVEPGFEGEFELLGTDTTFLLDDITLLDFGEGITVSNFQILSDILIIASISVADDSVLGSEHVTIVGNDFEQNGDSLLDVGLYASETPLAVSRPFVRGDGDGDGSFDGLVDGIFILSHQFIGGPPPPCFESADSDGDGVFNGLLDGLYVLNFQFVPGSPPPPPPHPLCGFDRDPPGLGCDSYPLCL